MHLHSFYSFYFSTVAIGFNDPSSDRNRAQVFQLGIVVRWMRLMRGQTVPEPDYSSWALSYGGCKSCGHDSLLHYRMQSRVFPCSASDTYTSAKAPAPAIMAGPGAEALAVAAENSEAAGRRRRRAPVPAVMAEGACGRLQRLQAAEVARPARDIQTCRYCAATAAAAARSATSAPAAAHAGCHCFAASCAAGR
jgi:hypothetical protein